MGLFTTISSGDKRGQVKLWNDSPGFDGSYVVLGDHVPENQGRTTYQIAMREGGFVFILEGVFAGWNDQDTPGVTVFDKWGDPWTGENYGRDDPFSPENLLRADT